MLYRIQIAPSSSVLTPIAACLYEFVVYNLAACHLLCLQILRSDNVAQVIAVMLVLPALRMNEHVLIGQLYRMIALEHLI